MNNSHLCHSCQKLQEYFANELKIVEKDKKELINELGEDVYNGMRAAIVAYNDVVNKTVKAF